MTNTSLAKQVLVRHREAGHLRFELPPPLCAPQALESLRRGLLDLPGVYRVEAYAGQRKLSVRYQEGLCTLRQVGERLRDAIAAVEAGEAGKASGTRPRRTKRERPQEARAGQTDPAAPSDAGRHPGQAAEWLKSKGESLLRRATEWRARAAALSRYAQVRTRHDPVLGRALPALDERAVLSFLVDIAALYLVKVHWELITKRWLQAPFTHRYEWATIFFLVFLLVRFRKQAPRN